MFFQPFLLNLSQRELQPLGVAQCQEQCQETAESPDPTALKYQCATSLAFCEPELVSQPSTGIFLP